MADHIAPKCFISYSWSSEDHKQRVLGLAERLVENGIDVVIDQWDLKEGHDAFAFMESSVNDDSITKVLMVCDREYQQKADERRGGSGTEAQIISPELYGQVKQEKFVVAVWERDEDGNPCVPTFARSNVYIDLSNPGTYAENFERLLRWAHDKPMLVKPKVGERPAFLDDEGDGKRLNISFELRIALEAIRTGRPVEGHVKSLYRKASSSLDDARMAKSEPDEAVAAFWTSVGKLDPIRDATYELLIVAADHERTGEVVTPLITFFENLIPYFDTPPGFSGSYRQYDFDGFKFFAQELFLYTVSALCDARAFRSLKKLLDHTYYSASLRTRRNEDTVGFGHFQQSLSVTDIWKEDQEVNWRYPHAQLLRQRCADHGVSFGKLIQADFICYLKSRTRGDEFYYRWFPFTMIYREDQVSRGPFEVFVRSRSADFANDFLVVFGNSTDEAIAKFREVAKHEAEHPVRLGDWACVSTQVYADVDRLSSAS